MAKEIKKNNPKRTATTGFVLVPTFQLNKVLKPMLISWQDDQKAPGKRKPPMGDAINHFLMEHKKMMGL